MHTKFRLLDLLSKAASGQLTQLERKNVDTELKQLGMISITQHVQDLCEIIGTDQIPQDNPQKDYAAIYLKNYLHLALASLDKPFGSSQNQNGKIAAGTQTILHEDLTVCAEILIKLILSRRVQEARRQNVQLSLEIILFSAQKLNGNMNKKKKRLKQQAGKQQNQNLILDVFNYIIQDEVFKKGADQDKKFFNEMLTIIAAIIQSCLNKDDLIKILEKCMAIFIHPLSEIKMAIIAELISFEQFIEAGSISSPEAKQALSQIVFKVSILTQWTSMHHTLLNKQKLKPKSHESVLMFFAKSKDYCEVFVDFLKMGQLPSSTSQRNLLLSFTGINELDLAFNQLKTKAMTILKKVWFHVIQKQPLEQSKGHQEVNSYIYQAALLQNDVAETLMYITQSADYEQHIRNGYVDSFIKSAL